MNHHTANAIHNQQRFIHSLKSATDSLSAFYLSTSDLLFDELENHLPEHRERLFPPTEILAMFGYFGDIRDCSEFRVSIDV